MSDDRFFFDVSATRPDVDMQVVACDGKVNFSINNDWCGNTESGFGATVDIDINREDTQKLISVLQEWLKTTE